MAGRQPGTGRGGALRKPVAFGCVLTSGSAFATPADAWILIDLCFFAAFPRCTRCLPATLLLGFLLVWHATSSAWVAAFTGASTSPCTTVHSYQAVLAHGSPRARCGNCRCSSWICSDRVSRCQCRQVAMHVRCDGICLGHVCSRQRHVSRCGWCTASLLHAALGPHLMGEDT